MVEPDSNAIISTPEGDIEVHVVKIENGFATIIWNEQSLESSVCVSGSQTRIPVSRLKPAK